MGVNSLVRAIVVMIVVFLVVSPFAREASAQTPIVAASVDDDAVTTDDVVTLTISVAGETNIPVPTLPIIDGVQLLGRTTASTQTLRNGQLSAEFSFSFRLRPLRPGTVTIPPVQVLLGGTPYETDPIEVTVTQGTGLRGPGTSPQQPSSLAGQEFFIEAEVDNDNPYLGEQVAYIVKSYASTASFALGRRTYSPPVFWGFWNAQAARRREYSESREGLRYRVTEFRTILFPTVLGSITIQPAEMNAANTFFSGGRPQYNSGSVTVEVQPLPTDAPPSFAGGVGDFAIEASVDVSAVNVGEPVTLTVQVSGTGNLDLLPDPVWPEMDDWRAFENSSDSATYVESGQLKGVRTYERILVPKVAGSLSISAIDYAFFDPRAKMYRTVSTQSIPIFVSPDPASLDAGAASQSVQSQVFRTAADIRHVKVAPDRLATPEPPLTSRPLYWAGWAAPALGMIAALAWRHRRRLHIRQTADGDVASASESALNEVLMSRERGEDPHQASGRILTEYLGAVFGRSPAGLTRQAVAASLTQADVSVPLISDLDALLEQSEAGRYAPGITVDPAGNVLDDAERLIHELDWELNR